MSEPKDTIELLQSNPGLFNSLRYIQETEKKPLKRTFLIGMPRSGTTLWLRMMEMACMSRCVGDKHESYFAGLINIYKEVSTNHGQYIDGLQEAERREIFADEYRGYNTRERELWNLHYTFAQLLFANTFRSGYAKSTQIGFTNSLLVPFVEMLRHLYEDDDLTICFMTRNVEAAAMSLINSSENTLTYNDKQNTIEAYEHQLAQMREASELGDVWIDYDKFVADPIPFLKRCNPIYLPNEAAVKRILELKLK